MAVNICIRFTGPSYSVLRTARRTHRGSCTHTVCGG